jgi:hypothetical protein
MLPRSQNRMGAPLAEGGTAYFTAACAVSITVQVLDFARVCRCAVRRTVGIPRSLKLFTQVALAAADARSPVQRPDRFRFYPEQSQHCRKLTLAQLVWRAFAFQPTEFAPGVIEVHYRVDEVLAPDAINAPLIEYRPAVGQQDDGGSSGWLAQSATAASRASFPCPSASAIAINGRQLSAFRLTADGGISGSRLRVHVAANFRFSSRAATKAKSSALERRG